MSTAVECCISWLCGSTFSFFWLSYDNTSSTTVVFPKEGQMRLAEHASWSNKFSISWAADYKIRLFFDLEGCLRMLALRVTWPSFGNTTLRYGS
jgi:hypothetical protein